MRPVQCSFREHGRRCTRNGSGRPALCRAHAIEVRAPVSGINFDAFLGGMGDGIDLAMERIDVVTIHATDRLIDGIGAAVGRLAKRLGETPIIRGRPAGARAVPPPRPNPPPPRPQAGEPDPREVLGFAPDAKLSRELIKARQRALLELVHPDKGGSTAATQTINVAAAALLKDVR